MYRLRRLWLGHGSVSVPTSKLEGASEADAKIELARIEARKTIKLSKQETERLSIIKQIIEGKDRRIDDLIEFQKSLVARLEKEPDRQMEEIARTRLSALENAQNETKSCDATSRRYQNI